MQIQGHATIVTGGGSGLSAGTARALARVGAEAEAGFVEAKAKNAAMPQLDD